MPIRITCPSCAATLSVKDEYAGRSVKCPKCAGIIPPQPTAPAPEPEAAAPVPPAAQAPPAPARSPFEGIDEPEKPAKSGSKITGRPAARSKPMDLDDDEDDRPRKKRREDDEGDRDEPRKKRRDEERDEQDDRPARRRRREDDGDDDDRSRRGRKPQGKSNVPLILGIVGFFMLTCCGGVGYGVYWAINKAKETVEKVREELERTNISVNKGNFDSQLKVGSTTRQQAESIFGKGRAPTPEDLSKAFGNDKASIDMWQGIASKNRAMLWQNGDDYIIVEFHPNMENTARVQMKHWKPKVPPGAADGTSDDAWFVQKFPDPKKGEDLSGPAVDATGEEISTAYKDNKDTADAKYKDKVVTVEGVLDAIDLMPDGTMYARLVGTGSVGRPGNVQPRCVVQAGEQKRVFECSRGQTIKFKGRCAGLSGPFVDVMSAKIESVGPDPSVNVTTTTYLADYARNEMMADEKYKEKQITLTNAVVESKTANAVYLVASGKAKTTLKIKVAFAGDFRKQFENLKAGDRISKLKGEGAGKFGDEVYLNTAWIVP